MLIYIQCDSTSSTYKLIDFRKKQSLSEYNLKSPYPYSSGRLSDDGKYIALHIADSIAVYDTTFTKLYQIENVGYRSLRWAYFKDGILVANSKEEGILNKYDVATGALLARIQIHEVQH